MPSFYLQETSHLSARIDRLVIEAKVDGFRNDPIVKVCSVAGLDEANHVVHVATIRPVRPPARELLRHADLMGPGELGLDAGGIRDLEARGASTLLKTRGQVVAAAALGQDIVRQVDVAVAVSKVVDVHIEGVVARRQALDASHLDGPALSGLVPRENVRRRVLDRVECRAVLAKLPTEKVHQRLDGLAVPRRDGPRALEDEEDAGNGPGNGGSQLVAVVAVATPAHVQRREAPRAGVHNHLAARADAIQHRVKRLARIALQQRRRRRDICREELQVCGLSDVDGSG